MERLFFVLGALSGALGVAAGAFGAHALQHRIGPDLLQTFDTAVRYHLIHALALLLAGWAAARWPGSASTAAGWLFVAGTVLFSGSLYALSLSDARWFGAITPVGGLAFLSGWAALAWAALRG